EPHAREVRFHDPEELRQRLFDVAECEIDERLPHPPYRVQHVHRALQNIGQMPPADAFQLRLAQRIQVALPAGEIESHRPLDAVQRRAYRAHDRLDQRGLAATRLARKSVDLAAIDVQTDAIDCAYLAAHAEIFRLIVGAQP